MEFVEVNDKFIKLIQEIVRDTIVNVMQQPQADNNYYISKHLVKPYKH